MGLLTEIEFLALLFALAVGIYLICLIGKALLSPKERADVRDNFYQAPVLTACATAAVVSVIGMLLWIGSAGRLSSGWSVVSMIAFGLVYLFAHDHRIRRQRKMRNSRPTTPPRS